MKNKSYSEDQMTIPQWHKNLLDDRESLLQEGKAHFIDWDLAKEQIQEAIA